MAGETQNDLVLQMLSESLAQAASERREIDRALTGVQAAVASMQASVTAQGTQLAEMRAENRTEMQLMTQRLAEVERQVQTLPHTNDQLRRLEEKIGTVSSVGDRRHQEIDHRVRHLEGDSRETGVFRRGAASMAAAMVRYLIPFAIGLIGVLVGTGKIPA